MCRNLYYIDATSFMRGNYSKVYNFALSTIYDALPGEIEHYRESVIKHAEKSYNDKAISYQHFANIVRATYTLDGSSARHADYETTLVGTNLAGGLTRVHTPIYDLVVRCSEHSDPETASIEPIFTLCSHKYNDDELLQAILGNQDAPFTEPFYLLEACSYTIHVIIIDSSEFLDFVKRELKNHRWFKRSNVNNRKYSNENCLTEFIACDTISSRKTNCLGNNIVQQLRDEKDYILIKMRCGKYYGTWEFVDEW